MAGKLYLVLALTIAASALCAQALWDEIIQFDKENNSVRFQQLCFVKHTLMRTMEHFKGEPAYERLQTDLTRINKAVTFASLSQRDFNECTHHSECLSFVKVNLDSTKNGDDADSVAEAYATIKETVKAGLANYMECWQEAEAEFNAKDEEELERWLEERAEERRREEEEAADSDDEDD